MSFLAVLTSSHGGFFGVFFFLVSDRLFVTAFAFFGLLGCFGFEVAVDLAFCLRASTTLQTVWPPFSRTRSSIEAAMRFFALFIATSSLALVTRIISSIF
jgi:hypothetical protein